MNRYLEQAVSATYMKCLQGFGAGRNRHGFGSRDLKKKLAPTSLNFKKRLRPRFDVFLKTVQAPAECCD